MTRTDSIRSSIEWWKRMRPVYPYDKRDSVLALPSLPPCWTKLNVLRRR